jgi:drug/metabolite transporter (DMT)-like permease
MSPTLRGCAMMTLSMLCFALMDGVIVALGGAVPAAQIVWTFGLGGALCFGLWLAASGQGLWSPGYLSRPVLLRSACEVAGSLFFVTALTLAPLTDVTAVNQAAPLFVALGGALFLGAPVGPRRWAAIAVGFGGVLLILRPGGAGFDPAILLAVAGTLGLSARDLVTRAAPPAMSGARLSLHALVGLVIGGAALQSVQGVPVAVPDAGQAALIAGLIALGIGAYLSIVAATRTGDIAVISSFRYTRMLFALTIGLAAFGERPDALTLAGAAIVIGAGLYTLIREARLSRARRAG